MAKEALDKVQVTVAIFTFPSVHYAMKAEKVCQDANLPVVVIPLPREISADCGVSLLVPWESREEGVELLQKAEVPLEGIHRMSRSGRQARMWQHLLEQG